MSLTGEVVEVETPSPGYGNSPGLPPPGQYRAPSVSPNRSLYSVPENNSRGYGGFWGSYWKMRLAIGLVAIVVGIISRMVGGESNNSGGRTDPAPAVPRYTAPQPTYTQPTYTQPVQPTYTPPSYPQPTYTPPIYPQAGYPRSGGYNAPNGSDYRIPPPHFVPPPPHFGPRFVPGGGYNGGSAPTTPGPMSTGSP